LNKRNFNKKIEFFKTCDFREFDTYNLKKHAKALVGLYFFVKFFSLLFRNIS